MTDRVAGMTMRRAATAAGISLLVMTVAAVFATEVTIGSLTVAGDAAATTANIRASETLFRAGILSWVVVLLCDVIAAWGLYVYLRPVSEALSLLAAWLRLVYAAMLGAAIFNYVDILLLLAGDSAEAADAASLPGRVMMRLDAFDAAWGIALIVFAVHILLLGWLAWKSAYIPGILGILMMLSFFGYVFNNAAGLLAPSMGAAGTVVMWLFIVPMVAGEVGLGLWLLVRGFKVRPRAGSEA
jgi:hypothetical protein